MTLRGFRDQPSRTRSLTLALLGGLCATASVPPFGWWPLGILGIAFLGLACVGASRKRRIAVGFVFGFTLYGISLFWMTKFSLPGGLIVALIQTFFTIVGLSLVRPKHVEWSLPGGLIAADALRSLWPFGGLPLGGMDLGQAQSPYVRIVAFGGRLALVGITALAAVGLMVLVRSSYRRALPVFGIVGLLTIGAITVPDGTRRSGEFSIAIAQGGGPRGLRASDQGTIRAYRAHLEATDLLTTKVDVILWPEDIVHVVALEDSKELSDLQKIARERNTTLIPGVIESAGPKYFWNRSVVINPNGTIGDRYTKTRLVPYGEYFPFRKQIEAWGLAALPRRDGKPGTADGIINTAVGPLAILISYEGFFDDRSRGGVRAGGEAIIIPTNASSYVSSQVPTQQIAAAQLRALEAGRWVAQAAPTGRSGFIDSRGRVVKRTVLEKRELITATIERRTGLTPYMRFNDLPALLLAAASIGLGFVAAARSRRNDAARPARTDSAPEL